MNKNIPGPILRRIWLLALCAVAVVAIGLLWSVIYQDPMMRMLSLVACFAISIRTISLYRVAKNQEYDFIDGLILSRHVLPLQKKQEIIIASEEGDRTLVLSGKTQLHIGTHYRLYVEKQRPGVKELDVSPRFLPGRSLLGYESISSSTGAKK